jgi:hypothetical protein
VDPLDRPPPRVADAPRHNVTQYVAAASLIALVAAMFLRVAFGSGQVSSIPTPTHASSVPAVLTPDPG